MEVQGQAGGITSNVEKCEEYRVQVSSKKQVMEQMDRYKSLLKKLLDGQTDMDQQTRTCILNQMLDNFSKSVQDNVLVNGQPWDDAPDDEQDEVLTLENQLDENIVETSRKRRKYPKEIVPHVVSSLKAERKLMGLYKETVKPEKIERDPEQDNIMDNIMNSVSSSAAVKEVAQAMKSMQSLQLRAQGLCEVLNTRPSSTDRQIYRDVFGDGGQPDALLPHVITVKRAVEMAEMTEEGYTELST